MLAAPEKILSSFLSKLSLKVSRKLIDQKLLSHPHYPSLLSITDTLDYLGIKNTAAEADRSHLHELTLPFLAHLKTNGGQFVIVENVNAIERAHPIFFDTWSGVVLSIEKSARWHHKENDEFLSHERNEKTEISIVLSLLFVFVALTLILSESWLFVSLIAIVAMGLFISGLTVLQELGIESEVVDKVCGKSTDCNSVIKSKALRLPLGINLSDLNIIWFSSILITLVLSVLAGIAYNFIGVLTVMALLVLPVTIYSVYYQWRVVKKWCRLCLITGTLLWLQFLVLWALLTSGNGLTIEVQSIFFVAAVFFMTSALWLIVKNLLQQNRKMRTQVWEAARFKANEVVFAALLEKQRKIDVTPWNGDLKLGNANAQLQLTVACNPYCNPCAAAHEKLNSLLERYENEIGLTVRFSVNASDNESKHTKAVAHILAHLQQTLIDKSDTKKAIYTKEVLHDWFRWMNLERFRKKYPSADADVSHILAMHESWTNKSKIAFTPTLFINGKVLPHLYDVNVLDRIVGGMLGSIEIEKIVSENTALA